MAIGPHLGILRPYGLDIPSRLPDWIKVYLASRILSELEILVRELGKHTPRLKNLRKTSLSEYQDEPQTVISLSPHEDISPLRLVIKLPNRDNFITGTNGDQVRPRDEEDGMRVDLSDFPIDMRPDLLHHFSKLLAVERTYKLRLAISNRQSLSAEPYQALIGKPPSHITRDGSGLGGHEIGLSWSKGARGGLGTDAMVALLRWRLYTGDGWRA